MMKEQKKFLLFNNYYRISGYSLTLRKNDVFSKNATFQNIVDIYNFDHKLRHIILQYIEMLEVQMQSIYSYEFTKVHGPVGYLDSSFFTNADKNTEIINKANQQKTQRLPHEAYLKHFINDLDQETPFWAYVDLLTISDISFLYSISEQKIKESVAYTFGLIMSRGTSILGGYMHSMTMIRNSAHMVADFITVSLNRNLLSTKRRKNCSLKILTVNLIIPTYTASYL